jgi:hypothetical protein
LVVAGNCTVSPVQKGVEFEQLLFVVWLLPETQQTSAIKSKYPANLVFKASGSHTNGRNPDQIYNKNSIPEQKSPQKRENFKQ